MQAYQNLYLRIFQGLQANSLSTITISRKLYFIAIAFPVILLCFVVYLYVTRRETVVFTESIEGLTSLTTVNEIRAEDPKVEVQNVRTGAFDTNVSRIKHPIPRILQRLGDIHFKAEGPKPTELNPGKVESPPETGSLYQEGFNISASSTCAVKGKNIEMLVVVISAPDNEEQRDIIRKTWGTVAQRNDTALAFLVGVSSNTSIIGRVKNESDIYGDIIQGNFMDTYRSLTLKTISMLEWAMIYCNHTKLLFKVDDDMFINFPKLFEILDTRLPNVSRSIIGLVVRDGKPNRDQGSKYCLTRKEYQADSFPDYNSGPAYIITADAVRDLYEASLKGAFLVWEDVYVTGVVAGQLGIKNIHVKEFYNNRHDNLTSCFVAENVSIHKLQKEETLSLWSDLSGGKLSCE